MLRTLLPEGQKNCSCGAPARVTWCTQPGQDLMDDTAAVMGANREFLCNECFAKTLKAYTAERGLDLAEIISPEKGPGFFTPVSL